MKISLYLVRCKTFFECKIFSVENIFQIFVLGSRKYIRKVFSVFGRACKSIFLENIFLHLAPQCKTFYRKMQKNIPILQLSISKYLYTSYMHIHYKISITKNMNIYTSKFYITMIEVPTYKKHNPHSPKFRCAILLSSLGRT